MRRKYVFSFSGGSIALAAFMGSVLAILLLSAGVLLGLYIYPAVSTSSPTKRVSQVLLTSLAVPATDTTVKSGTDSSLMYEINTLRSSDKEHGILQNTTYYAIQVGIFASRERGERRCKELLKKGLAAYIYPAEDKSRQWYAVRIGLFDNIKDARSDVAVLKKKMRIKSAVKQTGKL
ncbi:MAG: SPOR domain-containing protein [Bacteroidetes bacterium]|nr:SPOR domain-containing protein [Bacteroidota bacterium]MCZ2131829.1 SPOR domain-containing protein [Bacteroidota bacterium]